MTNLNKCRELTAMAHQMQAYNDIGIHNVLIIGDLSGVYIAGKLRLYNHLAMSEGGG